MPKTYVLDTNVLLHNPASLFAFAENDIVIPLAVIEEIDSQKRRQDEVGKNARIVSQKLDGLRALNSLSAGVRLPSGGTLRVELNHQETAAFPKCLNPEKHDNRILALAFNLGKVSGQPAILVTKDLNLRIKADVLGVMAEDFYNDKIDYHQLYTGVGEIYVSSLEMEQFYRDGRLDAVCNQGAVPHEFFIMKSRENPSQSALARYHQNVFWSLSHTDSCSWGIKALNKEQKFAFELLLNDQVKVVTLVGRAGTGKTLIALAAGLEKVVEQNQYRRLLITRPVTPMGEDLGYLPGTKEDKLRPWMQPIYDNLQFILRNFQDSQDTFQELTERGVLEMEALTYIRGRSIPKQFIICDEAQNLSPHMIKTLITRVGEGTKIVFTGDPEQIDHPYLDASSNGLTYLIERFKGEDLAGHVTLLKGERSKVAELGARLL